MATSSLTGPARATRPPAGPSPLPTVAVVVATRSRPQLLPGLVDAVLADAHASELVVVVDGEPSGGDGSSMAVLEALAVTRKRLRPLAVPRSGQLRALEIGIAQTTAEVVLLLDDDVLPRCSLAEGHARHHAGGQGLVVAGSMPVALPEGRPGAGTLLYARDYDRHIDHLRSGTYGVLDHLWLGNVSLRRADADRVGLTATPFAASYHTDRELGLRLARAGLDGRLDEELAAVHLHRRSTDAFLNDARRHGAGLVALHALHGDLLGPFDPDVILAGLPGVLRGLVAHAGSSSAALPLARALTGLGERLGRLGLSTAERTLAKLARRTMVRCGVARGERLEAA